MYNVNLQKLFDKLKTSNSLKSLYTNISSTSNCIGRIDRTDIAKDAVTFRLCFKKDDHVSCNHTVEPNSVGKSVSDKNQW